MGNYNTKSIVSNQNLDNRPSLDHLVGFRGLPNVENSRQINQYKKSLSNTPDLCPVCLDVLEDAPGNGAIKYHSTLLSLEESVRSGCHLCNLVKHFLPERPRHQLDENLTLSLRWDGGWGGILFAGWKHEVVSFNLVQLGDLTKFQRDYYRELEEERQPTMRIYKTFATVMLSHCIDHHPSCRKVQDPLWSPTRLIKIAQTSTGYELCLVTSRPQEPYVALSHCWGAVHVFKLLSQNLEDMKTNIKISRLPKTFQDAISITTWLNIRYIWIDSCCIIQDSIEDWQEESAMMDNVYRNAYCTIAADCAVDSNGGCIVDQNALVVRPCMLYTERGPIYCLPPEALLQKRFESEPLAQRAWALQERILSPRVLHCTTEQLFWECNETFKCQTYPSGLRANGDFRKVPRLMPELLGHGSLHLQWNGVIEDYCKRSLTREEDKLIALSGIAKAFQSRMTDDTYIAGLWYNSFPHSLLWRVIDPESVTRPSSYRAPSWSWAAIDGTILPNNTETAMDTCQLCLDVLGSDIDLVSEDPTGQVKGGSLQVRGLMKRAAWCTSSQRLMLVEDLPGIDSEIQKYSLRSSEFSFFPDARETSSGLESKDIYCLLVQSRFPTLDGMVICGTDEPDLFQRLGVFHATGATTCVALKYSLLPYLRYNTENPWELINNEGLPIQLFHSQRQPRANAMNITYRPDKDAYSNFRDREIRGDKSSMFIWENTYSPNHQHRLDNGPWKSTSASLQSSWDKPGRNSLEEISSTYQKTNSAETPWIQTSNYSSIQPGSSRKSKTKAIRAVYQAKMTDPMSVYLLDPVHTEQHFQRLKPRTITLV